jgi:hypothetical protein
MRRSIAAACLVAVALLPACSGHEPPNSLFDSSGYHVRADKVYYLAAFPGAASEIAGADAVSFKASSGDVDKVAGKTDAVSTLDTSTATTIKPESTTNPDQAIKAGESAKSDGSAA